MYALLLVVGCRMPSASVGGISLVAADLDRATVDVAVAIDNPLPVTIVVDEVRWAVDVADAPVATGVTAAPQAVPAGTVATVKVPVTARYAEVAAAAWGGNGAPYAVSGTVRLTGPLGSWEVPLDHGGTLPRLALPSLELVDADVALDGTAIGVSVTLRLGLPEAVRLSDVVLAVSTAEGPLARGSADVDAAGTLSLRAWVDPAAAAWAAASVWAGTPGEVRVALTGTLVTPIGEAPVQHEVRQAW